MADLYFVSQGIRSMCVPCCLGHVCRKFLCYFQHHPVVLAGKMPTVVSPELYRSRFLEAMDRYFLLVPDRWAGLGNGVDS